MCVCVLRAKGAQNFLVSCKYFFKGLPLRYFWPMPKLDKKLSALVVFSFFCLQKIYMFFHVFFKENYRMFELNHVKIIKLD